MNAPSRTMLLLQEDHFDNVENKSSSKDVTISCIQKLSLQMDASAAKTAILDKMIVKMRFITFMRWWAQRCRNVQENSWTAVVMVDMTGEIHACKLVFKIIMESHYLPIEIQ